MVQSGCPPTSKLPANEAFTSGGAGAGAGLENWNISQSDQIKYSRVFIDKRSFMFKGIEIRNKMKFCLDLLKMKARKGWQDTSYREAENN